MSEYRVPCFTLDRLSDDQTRAFFKYGKLRASKELVFRRLHEKQLVGAPVFSIQVREVVNDTGLPDLLIDDEKDEISFNWRSMLDQLMGEEHVYNTILSQRLGLYLDSGEDTSDFAQTHRKLARRSRLQRECRAKYQSNILDHYTHDETRALEIMQRLRVAASGLENTDGDDHSDHDLAMYTKQELMDKLPADTVIYSGNSSPGPKPGSIPRGIFTERDYCSPENQWRALPPPSAADLFSPRPVPDLSWGRLAVGPPPKPKRKHASSHGKREEPWTLRDKRRKAGR